MPEILAQINQSKLKENNRCQTLQIQQNNFCDSENAENVKTSHVWLNKLSNMVNIARHRNTSPIAKTEK